MVPNEGFINYMDCILYPDNLPEAWKKTPMKYSALEILSKNKPTTQIYYPKAVQKYKDFPQLEWFIKMGLYNLALYLINDVYGHAFVNRDFHRTRGIYQKGKTIFEILGLTKENTRILQKLDGDIDELRLLQEAQDSGYNLKADELERFYKIFGCNTTLIRKENRKASIHKICRYIEREGTEYRVGAKEIAGNILICAIRKDRTSEKREFKLRKGLVGLSELVQRTEIRPQQYVLLFSEEFQESS